MPKFDSTQFSDVEYDFTGFKSTLDGNYIQDKGTIPEPSRHMVAETMKAVSAAFKEMNLDPTDELGDNPTPDQVASVMSNMDEEEENTFEKMSDKLVDIISDFCQGHPTHESLNALSWPKFMAFFGYIMEHMLSPEASVPGTNTTPKRLKSV